jgi:hypothetical protein
MGDEKVDRQAQSIALPALSRGLAASVRGDQSAGQRVSRPAVMSGFGVLPDAADSCPDPWGACESESSEHQHGGAPLERTWSHSDPRIVAPACRPSLAAGGLGSRAGVRICMSAALRADRLRAS